jgi:D-alanyl-lipoteichoic acid acyltransferase DltB (MBOAT superfamily)
METFLGNQNHYICHREKIVAQCNATDFIWGLFWFWCSCYYIRWETTFIIILKHQKSAQVFKQKRKSDIVYGIPYKAQLGVS